MHSNPVQGPARLLRLGGIGLVAAALVGGFAWAGGWLGHKDLSPQQFIDTFESQAGHYPGYRKNHSKGLCVSGWFESSGEGVALSKARVFSQQRVPVIGRLAIGGANPFTADAKIPVRSMALQLATDDGQFWRTGMNTPPMLAVGTPQAFYEQILAGTPDPATGKPDPAKMQAFFAAHPESAPFRAWAAQFKPSDSFANSRYHGINAFRVTNAQGQQHFVRWRMEPQAPFTPLAEGTAQDPNFLAHDLNQRLAQGPLKWNLILTVAAANDPTDDASRPWPDDRAQVNAGTLTLDHVDAPQQGACRDLNFDPTILPNGIEVSDDPILAARASAYSVSFNRRTREGAPQEQQP